MSVRLLTRILDRHSLCFMSLIILLFTGCTGQGTINDNPTILFTTRDEAINFTSMKLGLTRGISTKKDVQQLLGEHSGLGGLRMPEQYGSRTIWFYEKTDILTTGQAMDFKQSVLLIFFEGEIFDGYFWFSD